MYFVFRAESSQIYLVRLSPTPPSCCNRLPQRSQAVKFKRLPIRRSAENVRLLLFSTAEKVVTDDARTKIIQIEYMQREPLSSWWQHCSYAGFPRVVLSLVQARLLSHHHVVALQPRERKLGWSPPAKRGARRRTIAGELLVGGRRERRPLTRAASCGGSGERSSRYRRRVTSRRPESGASGAGSIVHAPSLLSCVLSPLRGSRSRALCHRQWSPALCADT